MDSVNKVREKYGMPPLPTGDTDSINVEIKRAYSKRPLTEIDKERYPHLKDVTEFWNVRIDNIDYFIMVSIVEFDDRRWIHIRIKRKDKMTIDSFKVLQNIKNDFVGKFRVAVEIYPVDENVIDNSNTRHLWSCKQLHLPDLNELYEYEKG